MESEEGNERTQPQFRLVAWTPTTSGKDVAKVVRPVGLCAHNASFTTGLSALLLAPDHGLGEGDTLKLRLKGGAATVVREGNNVWRINRTQSHYVAPLMYDFRSVGR